MTLKRVNHCPTKKIIILATLASFVPHGDDRNVLAWEGTYRDECGG